ncbi:MFS transporter [Priestia megaterium]|uniref:MFS transporter n=1 Tax=Priestia megaterium TaxID=1404 RepID=UPI003A80B3B1
MKALYKDRRFQAIVAANVLSSIGSGITMLAIPLLLIASPDGNKLFGMIMLMMTVISFVATPYIGVLIDRMSRKKMLLTVELIGFITVMLFVIVGFMTDYSTIHYIILYGTGNLYYTFFYPTIFALNQEVFSKDAFQSLNSIMEIQGQLSSMLAGALASLVITRWSLQWILIVDAATYIAAFLFLLSIPYKQSREPSDKKHTAMKEGLAFIKENRSVSIFLLLSFMPFVAVMMTNYLFPIYLTQELNASPAAYGIESAVYSFGALTAGIFIVSIMKRTGTELAIMLNISLFALGISSIFFMKLLPIYFSIVFFLAFANAGTRVARNTFMMQKIPNTIVGRVDSCFRFITLGIRILLIFFFTYVTTNDHIGFAFSGLSLLLLSSAGAGWILYKRKQRKQSALLKSVL